MHIRVIVTMRHTTPHSARLPFPGASRSRITSSSVSCGLQLNGV